MTTQYSLGAVVVYQMQKSSGHPGRHATEVFPSPAGETYSYIVNKFWRVDEVLADGRLVVRTRSGKLRHVSPTDPALRPLYWWEWLFYRHRFPPRDKPAEA